MSIPSRQIGWSTQENLLWEISKQMEKASCQLCNITGPAGTSGTSGTSGYSGDSYRTTSTTPFTLGVSTTLTVAPGLAYSTAQDIIITYNLANHQTCMIVSYDINTGVMVIGPPVSVTGSGTYSSWIVNLDGAAGGDGSSGTSGTSGSSGTRGTSGTSGTTGTSGSSGTSATLPVSVSYGLFAQTADSTPVTATIVESSLIGTGVGTLTVPANGFSIGDSFTAFFDGRISCVGTATLHIRVKTLTGVLLADTGVIAMDAATDHNWKLDVQFTIRTLGTTGVASISSGGLFGYVKNSGNNYEGYVLSTINNTTFNTTVNNTLLVTAQWNTTNSGNSIFSRNFTLTKVY